MISLLITPVPKKKAVSVIGAISKIATIKILEKKAIQCLCTTIRIFSLGYKVIIVWAVEKIILKKKYLKLSQSAEIRG